MLTFKDIFKSDFITNAPSFSIIDTLIAVMVSLILGLVLYWVHKKTYRGVMYSASFGLTLIAMSVITAILIAAVTSNVVLSLGMVGALSIVRFRTAIKEPLDIAFIFWSIAIGIIVGAGLIPLAVFGTLIIAVLFLIGSAIKPKKSPYILVLSVSAREAEQHVMNIISRTTKNYKIKSKVMTNGLTEITVELYLKNEETDVVNMISGVTGVLKAALVSYNGEYMG